MNEKTSNCPHVGGCELFPMFSRRGFLRVWQINYCENDYTKCERYKLSLAGKSVPQTMLPNGQTMQALAKVT